MDEINENDTTPKSEINATMAFTQSLPCILKEKVNQVNRIINQKIV
jgi:hypothetical protein